MKRGTRKKHSASSARYYKEGRRRTAKIYGKKKPKKVKRSKSALKVEKEKENKRGNTPACQTTEYTYDKLENRRRRNFLCKSSTRKLIL